MTRAALSVGARPSVLFGGLLMAALAAGGATAQEKQLGLLPPVPLAPAVEQKPEAGPRPGKDAAIPDRLEAPALCERTGRHSTDAAPGFGIPAWGC